SFPGPEDAGSKPALLPPAEDREDPGTPGLLEKGAVPGQLGDSETIVIKTEEQQPQEDGAELLALPMARAVRLDEDVPLSHEQPVSWESHGVAGPKVAGAGLGEFCLGEFKPVVVPVEAHPAPGLPFPTEHALGAGTEQPFALAQGMPLEDPAAERLYRCIECAESFPQKASLEEHQRRHTQQRPFQCHGCTKSFRHRQSLNHHQKVHAAATSPAGSLPGHEPGLEPCEALSQDNR
ncbi:ZFP69 protein, partial [Dryoscopus gambensis]|nr:ZFP69 protein [Dryoscopus gambensis]